MDFQHSIDAIITFLKLTWFKFDIFDTRMIRLWTDDWIIFWFLGFIDVTFDGFSLNFSMSYWVTFIIRNSLLIFENTLIHIIKFWYWFDIWLTWDFLNTRLIQFYLIISFVALWHSKYQFLHFQDSNDLILVFWHSVVSISACPTLGWITYFWLFSLWII